MPMPAFRIFHPDGRIDADYPPVKGITIREHIAVKMMAALTASNYGGSMSEHALLACQQADALIAELAKEGKV